jgi:hypothetical protein
MVPVLVIIMAIDMRPRRVTRRVIMTLVLAMDAVGGFAGVAVRQRGIAEGKAGNTQKQSGNCQSDCSHNLILCCLQG